VKCPICLNEINQPQTAINIAIKQCKSIYCGRKCAGIGRRDKRTDEQKKEDKRIYDEKYRLENQKMLKAKKAEYFQKTYDIEKAKIERKKRSKEHAEYCRQPEYKVWKKEYDRKYKAKKNYGEFWESAVISMEIREECLERETNYEIKLNNGLLCKTQRRKRHEQTKRNQLEKCTMGNP